MLRLQISEFKRQLSHYLELVRDGETLEILARRRPLARVVGIQEAGDPSQHIQRLIELEILRPPRKGKLGPSFLKLRNIPKGKTKAAGVVDALIRTRREGR